MILVDGVPHEGTIAPFDLTDRGLTLGDGLFETMVVFGGVVHRLEEHLDRMAAGLELLGFAVPRARLSADVAVLAARAPATGGVLRLTVTRGGGARGLAPPPEPKPSVIVTLAPLNPALVGEPTTLAVARCVRRNDRSPLSRLKTLAYGDNLLALREAIGAGAKDAVLLNTADRVACSSVGNLFRLKDGRLETPPASEGVLAGIVRAEVIAAAGRLGMTAVERPLGIDDLAAADAVFLTNSVRLVQPVRALDGAPVGDGGHVARRLLDLLLADLRARCGAGALAGV